MLQPTLSAILGLLFVAVGGATVWLMFHAASRMKDRGASQRLVMWHRIGGYTFIALFAVMTYFMVLRVADLPGELSSRPMTHLVIAVVMMPLVFSKVLIARYYKSAYYSALMPLGLTIFSLGFVVVTIAAGPYLLRRASVEDISLASIDMGQRTIDVGAAQNLTQQRCATCHTLDRVIGARKDEVGWLNTVNRMREYPASNISADEAKTILAYLVSQVGVDSTNQAGEQSVGKAFVDTKCAKCHDLDRVYKTLKPADEWRTAVLRMEAYAGEGYFKPGERDEVVRFLSETQTPEAAAVRTASITKGTTPSAMPAPITDQVQSPGLGLPSYVVVGLVVLAFGGLLARRPGRPAPAGSSGGGGPASAAAAPAAASGGSASGKAPLKLKLARIIQQTADTKTLRFLLPEDRPFTFKPGQFITLTWVVDGAPIIRSYSISSSPTQSRYIEVTIKRSPTGETSVFAHDRATVGLTVEAKGPSGRFTFDEARQPRIVLVAGGSGITPMMSILRSIDDRCLSTDVTLLYAVRSRDDLIFERELREIERRVPNFRLIEILTQPDSTWSGPTGRLTAGFYESTVPDPASAHYFVCGPAAFMDAQREILSGLGVAADRILQEHHISGRSATPVAETGDSPVVGRVRFVASNVECDLPEGRSLIEVAEMNGVRIPSSCRQGQCGTCATRLLDGQVRMDAEDGLDAEAKAAGYVLTCVGRASGDVTLDA